MKVNYEIQDEGGKNFAAGALAMLIIGIFGMVQKGKGKRESTFTIE